MVLGARDRTKLLEEKMFNGVMVKPIKFGVKAFEFHKNYDSVTGRGPDLTLIRLAYPVCSFQDIVVNSSSAKDFFVRLQAGQKSSSYLEHPSCVSSRPNLRSLREETFHVPFQGLRMGKTEVWRG